AAGRGWVSGLAELLKRRGFARLPDQDGTVGWLRTSPGRPGVRVWVGADDRAGAGAHRLGGPAVMLRDDRDDRDGMDCVLSSLDCPELLPLSTGSLDTLT